MLTENEVVDLVSHWLSTLGYVITRSSKDTARGDDIAAISPNGQNLYVECKGSITRYGNPSDEWNNAAMATFGAIVDVVRKRPDDSHAIAFPNTAAYRETIKELDAFFARSGVTIFLVNRDGSIEIIACAPNNCVSSFLSSSGQ